jgi:hypothetical protein
VQIDHALVATFRSHFNPSRFPGAALPHRSRPTYR